MYIAKLVENKSERLLGKVEKPFFVPIQLIEMKLNVDNLESAVRLTKKKLHSIINYPANTRVEQLNKDMALLSFRNNQDGLKVTYQLQAYKD